MRSYIIKSLLKRKFVIYLFLGIDCQFEKEETNNHRSRLGARNIKNAHKKMFKNCPPPQKKKSKTFKM